MSFDWRRYIDLADALCRSGAAIHADEELAEAAFRAAISRAYYGVYRPCGAKHRDLWGQDPLNLAGMGSHRALQRGFEQKAHSYAGDKKRALRKIASNLDRLIVSRRAADYEDVFPYSTPVRSAGVAIRCAREVATVLQTL